MSEFPVADSFCRKLGLRTPILQAPMAGVSTPQMAAMVSNAGGLGALGLGAMSAPKARDAIREFRTLSAGPVNVNVFCHLPARRDSAIETGWISHLAPLFASFNAEPPSHLNEIYQSFRVDDDMLATLVALRPEIVSFHFGLPRPDQIQALRDAGIFLMATATSPDEARSIADAGLDAIIAQGIEAGGHRGIFDATGKDTELQTRPLVRELVNSFDLPVIAAGGIMTGQDIRSMLDLGAAAAQLGTAFIACDESSADGAYRARLMQAGAGETVMTSVISGRPARCLTNRFTDLGVRAEPDAIPAYPVTYDVGKALNAAAKSAGETGFGAHWAGKGADRVRGPMSAGAVIRILIEELSLASQD